MRILYLSQRFPYPPDRGDRITVYNHIKHLSQKHEIYAACLAESRKDLENSSKIRSDSINLIAMPHSHMQSVKGMIRSLRLKQPLTLGFYGSKKLASAVNRVVEASQPDAAIAFSSSMAQYLEKHESLVRVMYFCDMDSQKWADLANRSRGIRRLIYRREARLLLEYERKIAACFSASCVVSQREAELFHDLIPKVSVHVVENGVDYDYFQALPRNPKPAVLTFIGVMDYPPNIEAAIFFAKNILPRIRSQFPSAIFEIVGSRPSRDVMRLGATPGVHVTGFVPDVRPYLAASALVVVPLSIARGIQNKILEAMAAGVPVLATPAAAEGLTSEGRNLIHVADRQPQSFAAAALQLLSERSFAERKAAEAVKFVRLNYSWKQKAACLEEILEQGVQGNQLDPQASFHSSAALQPSFGANR